MSITHDNSGTCRTQAQREAARLIEAGEFIAADTPAGQAIIDALPEAAHRAEEAREALLPRTIVMKKPPTVETSISDIGEIIIHNDRDMMRAELQRAMERAATASFLGSGESKAVVLCLAVVSGDTIGILINTAREDGLADIECHAIFAYDDAVEALKKHNGLRVRFEASFSQPKITRTPVADQSEQS